MKLHTRMCAALITILFAGCELNQQENRHVESHLEILIEDLYPHFNARRIDEIMPFFTPEIDWPNGMTGGREIGQDAVREYWTNQWKLIDSSVTPVSYRLVGQSVVLEVRQLVKDLEGVTLADSVVYHTYQFKGDKISRMDINERVPEFAASQPANPL